jgi:flavodoxin/ferredoxin
MGKSIGIFYFSATGNTEMVVKMAQNEFQEQGHRAQIIRMEDVLKKKKIELDHFDLIGISHPIIGFGSPLIVYSFIKSLPACNAKKVFLMKTAGGVGPQNYPSSRPAIRKLKKKGYDVFYDRIFSIGSNWVVKFDDKVMKHLYCTTQKKVRIMCLEIIEEKKRALVTKRFLTVLMEMIQVLERYCMRLIGKDLHAAKECNFCKICIQNCPAANISEKNGKIRFGSNCNCCMRCVYNCPENAIHYRLFSFFELPGGYNLGKILSCTDESPDLTGVKKPPFLEQYMNDADF